MLHSHSDRFSRPTYAARSRPTQTTSAPVSEEESVLSEKAKSVAATPAARGRSYYQFINQSIFSFLTFNSNNDFRNGFQLVIVSIFVHRLQAQSSPKKKIPTKMPLMHHRLKSHRRNGHYVHDQHSIFVAVHGPHHQAQLHHHQPIQMNQLKYQSITLIIIRARNRLHHRQT